MLKTLKVLSFAAGAVFLMIAAVPTEASATTITLSTCFTAPCTGLTGSITVQIDNDATNQNTGTGDVKVVITNGTNGFIDEIGLLYNNGGSNLPADTQIEGFSSAPPGVTQPSFALNVCQNDNTGQGLNNCQDYASNNADRFDAGTVVTFFLDSNTADILASAFLTTGAYAHIQEIGGGTNSAKITDGPTPNPTDVDPVPEPASLLLLGSGLTLAAAKARRRARQAQA